MKPFPWLDKKEWKDKFILSSAKSNMRILYIFAFAFALLPIPAYLSLADELKRGNYGILFVLVFPIASLFVFKKAISQTREWLRFGIVKLEMDPFPSAIDGHVGGRIAVNNLYDVKQNIEFP